MMHSSKFTLNLVSSIGYCLEFLKEKTIVFENEIRQTIDIRNKLSIILNKQGFV